MLSFLSLNICAIFIWVAIITIVWLSTRRKNKNVCVLVLGDIGRSPRMQNHAFSFAKEGYNVDLIGYPGSQPLKELREHPNVDIRYMKPPPNLQERVPRLLSYAIKVIWQSVTLLVALGSKRRSSYLILQNPPAIPTIPLCWLYCSLMHIQLTIDWHNYAHTIQALSSGSEDAFVKLTRLIEFFFGCGANSNICVSEAMRSDLEKRWSIKAKVLYDRPSLDFHPISLAEKHSLLLRLSEKYEALRGREENSTVFTELSKEDKIVLRKKRPALIVSSTSWTPDEDFGVLIAALQEYEEAFIAEEVSLPDIICFVTGKGPLKEFYTSIIKLRNWEHVTVITPWLENEDYPKILGKDYKTELEVVLQCNKNRSFPQKQKTEDRKSVNLKLFPASADLGICLHTSSSGLDLPMKLVDMFGSGLPAFAYDYKCLNELLLHERNGMAFADDKHLARLLIKWFDNFPENEEQRMKDEKFREQLKIYQEHRWHDNWLENAAPLFT